MWGKSDNGSYYPNVCKNAEVPTCFFKEDKELRKHERNTNLDLYEVYNIINKIAN